MFIFDLIFAGYASGLGQMGMIYIYSIGLQPYFYVLVTSPLIIGSFLYKEKLKYVFQTIPLILFILCLDFLKYKLYGNVHPFDPLNKLYEYTSCDQYYDNYSDYLNLSAYCKNKIKKIKMANLDKFPNLLFSFPNLEELDFSDSKIQTIDCNSIKNLNLLQELDLSSNQITEIPECINSLPNLRILNLSANKLKTIDSSLLKNHTIRELYLRHNNLRIKNKENPNLENLTHIHLSDNYIDEIPISWKSLKALETILINNNKYPGVPKNLELVESLENIYLMNSKIQIFPERLLKLKKLSRLDLDGNSITFLPSSVCKKYTYPNGKPYILLGSNPIKKNSLIKIKTCNQAFNISSDFID